MVKIEEHSKAEELLGRDRQRRGALVRMMSAWASRERRRCGQGESCLGMVA